MTKYLLLLAAFLVTGCAATITHQPEQPSGSVGIRYYRNAPYLLVYSDGKGGLKWQILYLPDQSQIMTVDPVIEAGHGEMNLYFQNGVLTSASSLGDTTEVPKAIITAIQNALPLITRAFGAAATPNGFPPPYLYKIVATNTSITFVGGRGDTRIETPINQGAAP